MAKQVEDIFVRLNVQNAEALSGLRSSFRELSKVIAPANVNLGELRQQILDFGNTNARSEQLIKGQIEALKGLQKQAGYTTQTYKELGNDIESLDAELRGSTTSIDKQREALVKAASASKTNAEALRSYIASLERLQQQTRGGSAAYEQLGRDIAGFSAQLETTTKVSRTYVSAITAFLGVKPDAVVSQWRKYQAALNDSTLSAEQLAEAQRRLNQLSGAPRILERQAINDLAEITADPEYQRRFGIGGASLPELANVPAKFSQELSELRRNLASTNIESEKFITTLVEIARVENQAAQSTVGLGQALVNSIRSGETPTTINTITNALNTLRSEINNIDQSTIEGGKQFAQYNNQIVALEAQLNKLTNSYRNVASAATDAAAAQRASATTRNLTNLYLNNVATTSFSNLIASNSFYRSIASAGLAPGVPLLPPAGGTSSTGRGMARSLVPGRTESTTLPLAPGGTLDLRRRRDLQDFFTVKPIEVEAGSAAVANLKQSLADLSASTIKASRPLKEIYIDISKVGQASRGSVDELQLQKRLFEELRNAVNPASQAYKRAGNEIDALEQKLQRLERPRKRQGFTGLGAAQTAGAVISGGIFGGPEGFLGGLLGAAGGFLAGGGPGALGGAFAGSAAGAQLGIFRQQLSDATTYAAEIGKLRIALAGVVSTTQEYAIALRNVDAVSRDFNTPLGDTTQQYTKLSAAILASGGTLQDADTAYRGLSSAIIATGGSQEDLNGALLAAIQVYSKGKVSAEELSGQIGERLAGAFAKFAESTDQSTQQLSKSLRDGKVTISDFNKFLAYLQKEYKKTSEEIANSPEQAGRRLNKALDDLRRSVGEALQPTGVSFQNFATDAVRALTSVITKLQELNRGIPKTALQDLLEGKTSPAAIKSRIAELRYEIGRNTPSMGNQVFADLFPITGVNGGINQFPSPYINSEKQIKELKALTALLKEYEEIQRRLGRERKAQEDAAATAAAAAARARAEEERKKLREKGAQSLLQAITQREEQLFDARKQYEEQIAEIRKAAIEQARDLERQFNEDRLQAERETANTLRNTAATRQDITFLQRKIAGEDPRLVDFEQQIAEIERNAETAKITAAQKAADAERKQKQSIADFELKTAQSLNKANETYAKRIGEIQVNYAKTVANILDDVSGRTAKKLILAQELMINLEKRNNLNTLRLTAGLPIIPQASFNNITVEYPKGVEIPGAFFAIDKDLLMLRNRIFNLTKSTAAQDVSKTAPPSTAAPSFAVPQFLTNAAQAATNARGEQAAAETEAANLEARKQSLALIDGYYTDMNKQIEKLNTDMLTQQVIQASGINPELLNQLNLLQDTYTTNRKNVESINVEKDYREELLTTFDGYYATLVKTTKEYYKQLDAMKQMQDLRIGTGFQEGINQYVESIGTLRKATTDLTVNGIKGVEDAIFNLATTGTANFKQFALDIIQQTTRIIIQQFILRNILSGITNLFGIGGGGTAGGAGSIAGAFSANAYGNAYARNGIQPFAMGGIVTKPTLFKYANGGIPGTGLMGEAGPEAIIPLRRGRDGRLGVAGGAGAVSVTVNVDAKGTNAEGNSNRSEQLGRVISQAVQAELIKQRRPGGLLT